MPIVEKDLESRETLTKFLNSLEATVEGLKASSPGKKTELPQAAQAHGLCEDQACKACATQSQELVDAGFAQGQATALENLDQWLLMAGGEELRQKIILMAARGQALYEASQQGVSIVA